ncbi:hypothetical protein JW868_01870 [Candidatus Woesearchaeota archaeon]|nr:hypothetical protein [Candidatus Woesearchaeota archaeon]
MSAVSTMFVIAIVYLAYWIGIIVAHFTQDEIKVGKRHLRTAFNILTIVLLVVLLVAYQNLPSVLLAAAWAILSYYVSGGDCLNKYRWGYAIAIAVLAGIVYGSLSKPDAISLISIMVVMHLVKGSQSYVQTTHLRNIVRNRAAIFYFLLLAWFLGLIAYGIVRSGSA